MQTVSLSFEAPDYSASNVPTIAGPASGPVMKKVYPCVTLPVSKGLAKSLNAGQEMEVKVKMRIKEVTIRDRAEGDDDSMYGYGPHGATHIEVELQSIDLPDSKYVEDDGNDGMTALANFRNKRLSAPKSYPMKN